MAIIRLFQQVYTLFLLGFFGYALVRGYRRRRPFWNTRSWLLFGGTFAFALLVCAAAVVLVEAIASGMFAANPNLRDGMIVGWLGLMVVGAGLLALLLYWFAYSQPEGTFPAAFRAAIRQALFPASR